MQFRLEPDGDAVWLSIGLDRAAAAELIGALAQFLSAGAQQPQRALPAVDGTEHTTPAPPPVAGLTPPPPAADATAYLAGKTVLTLDRVIGPVWREGMPPLRPAKWATGTRYAFPVAEAPLKQLIAHIRDALVEASGPERFQMNKDHNRLALLLRDRQKDT